MWGIKKIPNKHIQEWNFILSDEYNWYRWLNINQYFILSVHNHSFGDFDNNPDITSQIESS